MLTIYNTLGRRKEPFTPLREGHVGLYVCGITVYDHCHVGHARSMLVYDILLRHLLASGYEVSYVRNITDVDDKIIARAASNGEAPETLAARFIEAMRADAAALDVLEPTFEPQAVGHIDGVISMIHRLMDGGHAYAVEGGDVLFAVRSCPGYGKLSGRKLDELRAGARITTDERKRDPLDFVLWKASREGEPSWPSPWGDGRPGWHIECSAMSTALLGAEFDIHGGGLDLEFPHHENEIAQSECANGGMFARYWMHNGMIRVDGEKMSKSTGNFLTIGDALADWRGEEIRFFVVASHYRSPVDFSQDAMASARNALRRLYTALRGHAVVADSANVDPSFVERFVAAMDDDLNTAEAVAVLHELATELNREEAGSTRAARLASTLVVLGGRLGILQGDPQAVLQSAEGKQADGALTPGEIEALIEERRAARGAKDFARGDTIRDTLAEAGILLEDAGGQTTWRRR